MDDIEHSLIEDNLLSASGSLTDQGERMVQALRSEGSGLSIPVAERYGLCQITDRAKVNGRMVVFSRILPKGERLLLAAG